MKEEQEWLGHKQLSTTANIYAHIDKEMKNNQQINLTVCFVKRKKQDKKVCDSYVTK